MNAIYALAVIMNSPVLATAASHTASKTFDAVVYREVVHGSNPQRLIIGVPPRSVELSVTFEQLSFVDYERSFSMQFRGPGCSSATDIDGYSEVSTASALATTLGREGVKLAKACGLSASDRTIWRLKAQSQAEKIIAAVKHMQSRATVLIGSSLVRCEMRSPGARLPPVPQTLDGMSSLPTCLHVPGQKPTASAIERRAE
jgi:hypothetical protein